MRKNSSLQPGSTPVTARGAYGAHSDSLAGFVGETRNEWGRVEKERGGKGKKRGPMQECLSTNSWLCLWFLLILRGQNYSVLL